MTEKRYKKECGKMGNFDRGLNGVSRKKERFDNLKVGDVVKIPPYGRKAHVAEKYPFVFVVVLENGCRECFNFANYAEFN